MWKLRRKPRKTQNAIHSAVLLALSKDDLFTVGDQLNGGVAIMGASGSGKSSGSGRAWARALVSLPGSGGLILAAKPEDRRFWVDIFEASHRGTDLLFFGPDEAHRFNFLAYETGAGGKARNITRTILTIGESLRSSGKAGGEDGEFFEKQNERLIYNAVVMVLLATGGISAPDLQRFITTAAQAPQQLSTPEWQDGYHNRCLKLAYDRPKSQIEAYDFPLSMDFWLSEFPAMADRTRSSILAGVMGILHTFNTGIVRLLVSTTTTISPDDLFKGKWILVDMAPTEWGDAGSFVAAGWKYLAQRAILRRHVKEGDNIVTIWCDEAWQFFNSFDAHFIAQCRSHQGSLVYLTQSRQSYYAAMKGQAGRHEADAFLANFQHKVFHSLGDVETSEWACLLVGRSLQNFFGGSSQQESSVFDELLGTSSQTASFSEHFEAVLQPNAFLHGLRTGGPANDFLCDAIIVRSGTPFSSGQNWIKVSFSQR